MDTKDLEQMEIVTEQGVFGDMEFELKEDPSAKAIDAKKKKDAAKRK